METVGYLVRVQALEGYALKIQSMTYTEDYVGILGVRHNGSTKENPHYHIVIRTAVNPQAFRKRMKTLFPDGKGNPHMAITGWDGDDKALSYLFHEEADVEPLIRKGISDEFLTKLRSDNVEISLGVQKSKTKASHTLEEDVYNHCLEKGLKGPSDIYLAKQFYLLAHRLGKYPPQPWKCKAMVIKVKFRLMNGSLEQEDEYAENLAKLLYPDRY
jgi:hypothetical protein